jgi:hypothetical protein
LGRFSSSTRAGANIAAVRLSGARWEEATLRSPTDSDSDAPVFSISHPQPASSALPDTEAVDIALIFSDAKIFQSQTNAYDVFLVLFMSID